jgi:hypothetical protein
MDAAVLSKNPQRAHHNNTTLARWKSAGNRAKNMARFMLVDGFAKPSDGPDCGAH